MSEPKRRYCITFACGHRKTRRTTAKNGRCLKCAVAQMWAMRAQTQKAIAARQALQPRARDHWDKCDHPKTPENSANSGRKGFTCKTCKRARDAAYGPRGTRAKTRKQKVSPILQAIRLDLVRVPPAPVIETGRSYTLFPPKRRSA